MSILDTLLGKTASDAANSAASDTYAKQQAAAQALKTAGTNYQSDVTGYAQAYNPYIQGGGNAQNQVYNLLGLNGGQAQQQGVSQFQSDPGYQFQMQQGERAIDNSAAARSGGLPNGATLKALQRFGTGLADQSYGNYYNRLAGQGQQGLQATGAQAGLLTQGAQGNLQAQTGAAQDQFGSAGTIGQGQVAGANAQSSALGNLIASGAYLGGAAMGGGFGTSFGNSLFGPSKKA